MYRNSSGSSNILDCPRIDWKPIRIHTFPPFSFRRQAFLLQIVLSLIQYRFTAFFFFSQNNGTSKTQISLIDK